MDKRSNVNTLIACLPNESKDILRQNGIIVSILASKTPSFYYVAFVKELSINDIILGIDKFLRVQLGHSPNHESNKRVLAREMFKLFGKQISLKKLGFGLFDLSIPIIDHLG